MGASLAFASTAAVAAVPATEPAAKSAMEHFKGRLVWSSVVAPPRIENGPWIFTAGETVAILRFDGLLQVLEFDDARQVRVARVAAPLRPITCADANGGVVAIGYHGGQLAFWDVRSGTVREFASVAPHGISMMAWIGGDLYFADTRNITWHVRNDSLSAVAEPSRLRWPKKDSCVALLAAPVARMATILPESGTLQVYE